jgi:flagellar export protein FliJ
MSSRVFEVLQHMLKMRKDRSVAQSKRVQAEYQRVRSFNDQIQSYANEYESNWMNTAQNGDTVLHLQTQASFGQKLRATAQSQQPEVQALEAQSRQALEKAVQDSQRLKTLQKFLVQQERQRQHAQERQDERALEDALQARHRSK